MARVFECPLFRLEPECPWTWEMAEMPDDFKAEPYRLQTRIGPGTWTTLSESVRTEMWVSEHQQELHDAVAQHLHDAHDEAQLVEHVAWEPYESEMQ